MRYVLSVLVAGLVFAGANRPDMAKIDHGYKNVPIKYVAPQAKNFTVVYVDTAANQYGIWTTIQDPLNVSGNNVVLAERIYGDGSLGSGALGVVFSSDGGSTWTKDWPVNGGLPGDTLNGDYYLARYPTSWLSSLYPGASWPELIISGGSVSWGQAGVGNEPDWSTPGFYGVFSRDIGVHKVIAKCCGNGSVQGLAYSADDILYYFAYDPAAGDFTTSPTQIISGVLSSLEAVDCYNNNLYAFVIDTAGAFGYYEIQNGTPGNFNPINVSGLPTNGEIWWDDFAVLGDGSIAGVYAIRTDTSYVGQGPYYADQIWFSKGGNAVRLDSGSGHVVYYPQLAVDRNNGIVVAVWAQADANYDSTIAGFWGDIYAAWSTDGGNTFSDPVNITATPDVNEQMPEVAKTIGADGKVWLLYGVAADGSNGDLFNGVATSGNFDVYPTQYNVGYFTPVSVGENHSEPTVKVRVFSDLRNRSITVNFSAKTSGEGTFKLYNLNGRLVKMVKTHINAGANNIEIKASDLPSGVYMLRISTPDFNRTAKAIMVK